MKSVHSDGAPKAIGPYSQAIAHNGVLFVSGQLPIDPATGEFCSDDPAEQARQCLKNIRAIVEAAGSTLESVVKTTIMVTDLAAFVEINAVYGTFFSEPYPARATFQVAALPKGARVEIEAVAALGE